MENQNQKIRVKYPFLYGYQADGVQELLDCDKVLLADTVGLGKSVQAIVWFTELQANKVLLLCPAPLIQQWSQEISKFSDNYQIVQYRGTPKQRKKLREDWDFISEKEIDSYVLVTSYETMRQDKAWFQQQTFDCLVCDEIQKLKNNKSLLYKSAQLLRAKKKLGLTATPFVNNPRELFNIMSFLRPGWIPWWQFAKNHCVFETEWYGSKQVTSIVEYKNLPELKTELQQFMVRRHKEAVLPDLPQRTKQTIYCALSKSQARTHKELLSVAREDLRDGNMRNVLAYYTFMRMVCDSTELLHLSTSPQASMFLPCGIESSKTEALLELIEGIDGKILIFTQWAQMCKILRQKIPNSLMVSGSSANKDGILKAFRELPESEAKVLISTDTLNHGVNLECANTVIHFDLPFSPSVCTQREGRIDRVSQKNKIHIITLLTENSIEGRIVELLEHKEALFGAVVNEQVVAHKILGGL